MILVTLVLEFDEDAPPMSDLRDDVEVEYDCRVIYYLERDTARRDTDR